MLLVDKDICGLLAHGTVPFPESGAPKQTYIEHGSEGCVTNIGYDLRAESFFVNGKAESSCELAPGESAFVTSQEIIGLDAETIGRIALKNSRIRMGLTMDAPVYQPGHITPIYFRLTNISQDVIKLSRGEKYAMIMFEQLDREPEESYNGAFQKELSFDGLAGYKSQYMEQIRSIKGQIDDFKTMEKSVYGNVITILTIFMAIFTILNVNIELTKQAVSGIQFLAYNVTTLGALSFLANLMHEILHRKEKRTHWLWIAPAACFLFALILFTANPALLS